MKTKDGGATPKKDPTQNGTRGTPKQNGTRGTPNQIEL